MALAPTAPAQESGDALLPAYEGDLYAPDSGRGKLLFRYAVSETPDGRYRRATFTTPGGELAATEEVRARNGGLAHYTVVHHQAGRKGEIRREGDQLVYRWTEDGETQESREAWSPEVVVGALLGGRIRRHWAELLRGESFEVQLAVADRRTSYGFEVSKTGERRLDGAPVVVVEVAPSSFLLSALVDPIAFTISRDGDTIHEIHGRATPLRRVGGSWEPTVADGVYRKVR